MARSMFGWVGSHRLAGCTYLGFRDLYRLRQLFPLLMGFMMACTMEGFMERSPAWGQMFGSRNLGQNPLGRTRSLMEELEARGFGSLQVPPSGGPRPNPLARPTPWGGSSQAARSTTTSPPAFRLERALTFPQQTAIDPYVGRARASRIYPPRLQVAFPVTHWDTQTRAEWLTQRLRDQLSLNGEETIEVHLEGEKAILQGEVESDRVKNLARLLVLFEPGIAEVDDSRVVVRSESSPDRDRQTLPPGGQEQQIREGQPNQGAEGLPPRQGNPGNE